MEEIISPLPFGLRARALCCAEEDTCDPARDMRYSPVGEAGYKPESELVFGTTEETAGLWLRPAGSPGLLPLAWARLTVEYAWGERYEVEFTDPNAAERLAKAQGDYTAFLEQACAQNRRVFEAHEASQAEDAQP